MSNMIMIRKYILVLISQYYVLTLIANKSRCGIFRAFRQSHYKSNEHSACGYVLIVFMIPVPNQ